MQGTRVTHPSFCYFYFFKGDALSTKNCGQHANKTHCMPLKYLFKVAWLAYSSCVGGLSLNFVDLI